MWGSVVQHRLSMSLGSLANQEALNVEAWHTRRPLSINTLISMGFPCLKKRQDTSMGKEAWSSRRPS